MEQDIGKEFTQEMMYGFGVEDDAAESFSRVRGNVENEPMHRKIQEDRDQLLALAEGIRRG